MPAIIDKELFEAAQKRLIRNKRQGGQRAHGLEPDETPRFWLTGKLYCGKCDTPMQGYSGTSHTQRKYYYYSCSNARKHKCSLKNIKKDKIESIVCCMLAMFLEITGWYGSDKREVTWHDVEVAIKKGKRKSKKGSSACVSSPPAARRLLIRSQSNGSVFLCSAAKKSFSS